MVRRNGKIKYADDVMLNFVVENEKQLGKDVR